MPTAAVFLDKAGGAMRPLLNFYQYHGEKEARI